MGKANQDLNEISGKDLAELMGINPQDYIQLYPNREKSGYCPCRDILVGDCHGTDTVMRALTRENI